MREWLRTKLGPDPRTQRLEEDLEAMRVQCAEKDKLNARALRDEAWKLAAGWRRRV